MKNLRYTIPLLAKASDESGILEGYASTFGGPPDSFGDIVAPGAFLESLEEHKAAGTAPAMLWTHDQSKPIGIWQELHEDNHGLFVQGKLTMGIQRARDAFELALDGALALSIGFKPVNKSRKDGANILEAVWLGEISLVGLPANPRAQITAVKSLAGICSIREYENLLKSQFGVSKREAKKLSMGGWKAYRPDTEKDLAEIIRASAHNFLEL